MGTAGWNPAAALVHAFMDEKQLWYAQMYGDCSAAFCRFAAAGIECSVYYSLRQIYAARIFLFAVVDFLLICSFSFAAVLTGKLFVEEILIQFILPYIVTCCICFRTLYSRKICSEALAVLLCIVWCAVWAQLVLDEELYKMISLPVWMAMLVISVLCLGRLIYRGQKCCEEMWEVKPLWS